MPAADTARLVAQLTLDDKRFTGGINNATKATGSLEKALNRASKGVGTAAHNLGKLGAIGGGLVVAGLAASVQEASNLNEQISKAGIVFGDASDEVIAFSQTTAESLGLAQSAALEAAGGFGNMFKTTGIADKAAGEMSTTMVTLAADMASFNNEDPTEMLDRLRSGLSGEAEPLRRFGVLLSEAAVQQEAYATGIAETGEKLTEAQKVQARYSLILKQTKLQQGDFARTSGSLANQQRILTASLRDTGATIGTALLPKITDIAVKINKLIKDNGPAIQDFANKLPGAFDRALAFAERIPWATIGAGLEKAAHFAGTLFDIFLSMPPEVQTTLIALAGLNKLSGGAITGVVSELGKGLIKGVLSMTAGIVHITAKSVTGGPMGAPGGQTLGGLSAAAAGAAGIGVVILGVTQAASASLAGSIATAVTGNEKVGGAVQALQTSTSGGSPLPIFGPIDRLMRALQGDFRSGVQVAEDIAANTNKLVGSYDSSRSETARQASALLRSNERAESNAKINADRITREQAAAARTIAASERMESVKAQALLSQIKTGLAAVQAASRHAGQQAAAAIRDKDLSFKANLQVNVSNKVWVGETIKTQTTFKKLGGFVAS